jgi:hypothetical protein
MPDELLGYVPRPGYRDPLVAIDGHGLRVTDGPVAHEPRDGAILAVGDSFTFGEEVGNAETWPAQLQGLTGRRVLNGGVSGYGFDQTVLRAEQLTALHKPSSVVVSFIADDIRRTEMRRLWGYDKPWFAIEHDAVVLKGVPLPPPPQRRLLPPRVAERLLVALSPWLQYLLRYHQRAHPAGTGLAIAPRLVERLAALGARSGAQVIVLAQYDPKVWLDRAFANEQRGLTQTVLDRAAARGLATLDTFASLSAEPSPRALYRAWHMNARGNLLVARLVARALADAAPAARRS